MANHTIRSEHRPCLEFPLAGNPLGRIDGRIELTLKLTGFILAISRGEIQSIQTGTLNGEDSVFCEGIQLMRRDAGEIKLPGKIECN